MNNLTLVVSLFYIAFVAGAQLSNNYLPPGNAKTAGGSGRFLATPFQGSSSFSSSGARFNSGYGGGSIIRFNNNNNGDGSYSFDYQTDNKISHNEAGRLKNAGSQNEAEEVHGSYSYTSPEGQVITVNYVADENGFQPTGAHLPTPPPIPDAILKSLQQTGASGSYNSGFSSGFNRHNNHNSHSGYQY